jgi:predicted nuclease of restriction endonuclease-like (RecB) superfamily
MAKRKPPGQRQALVPTSSRVAALPDFDEVLALIDAVRAKAVAAVNRELVGLYWQIGEYISRKIASAAWGEGVVDQLAAHIARRHPGLRGFTRANLFRMRQFFEAYRGEEKVAPLVRQLSWTHNLLILSRSKRAEERAFYPRMALEQPWSKRELKRQLNVSLFERVVLSPVKVSPPVRQLHPDAAGVFGSISIHWTGSSGTRSSGWPLIGHPLDGSRLPDPSQPTSGAAERPSRVMEVR